MNVQKNVGINIKKMRLANKMTQSQLAEKLGIRQAYVSEMERGRINISVTTAYLISKALDVDICTLLQFPEEV